MVGKVPKTTHEKSLNKIASSPHRRPRIFSSGGIIPKSAAHFPSDFSVSKRQKLDACGTLSPSDSLGMERLLPAERARTRPHPDLSTFCFSSCTCAGTTLLVCGNVDDTT
ncbi:hypothetical protein RRG08_038038 [Elysia crispata]|uniref:Uncharacterized protein n=1 Tax=Elysia crispata TaxID=231223 RepID=A0AAE0ZY05_9GAST|nr:hypothetical protein RRG08_038038 [Elysia crispata]